MTQNSDISGKSWIMVAVLGFTWGGTFLVTELALTGITPFWLAAGRIGFAAVLMLAIWQAMGGRLFAQPPRADAWAAMVAIGAFSSAIPFMLLAWGQQYVTSGFAGVSMASVALTVLPLAHFFVPGERLTLRRTIGFLIGFAGVCVLVGGRAFESTGAGLETAGRMACVGAALCYGISSVLMRRLPQIDPIALIVEGLPPLPSAQTLLVIAFLGLVPTAAANFLRVTVIRTAGPVFMSLTNYQVPVWSVLMGIVLLGEPAPPSLFLAMALILAGVGLSQYGALRRLFGASRAGQ